MQSQFTQGGVWRFVGFDPARVERGRFRSFESGTLSVEVTGYTSYGHISGISLSDAVIGSGSLAYFYEEFSDGAERLVRAEYTGPSVDGKSARLRVLYTYYGSGEAHGSLGYLKTATQEQYLDGAWVPTGTRYYRYTDTSGADPVKYALEPEAFEKLKNDPEVSDPFTASDAKVAEHADRSFEYDASGRVTKETVLTGPETTFSYEDGDLSDSDFNSFKLKTVATRSDGHVRTTYTNFRGQVLLEETKKDVWAQESHLDYRQYDSDGNLVLHATSAALSGYSVDGYTVAPQYRSEGGHYNVGLMNVYDYYTETTTGSGGGAVKGFKQHDKIKRGRDGAAILLGTYEYTEHSATIETGEAEQGSSSGSPGTFETAEVTIYPIAREIRYRNEDGTGEIVTSFSYSWHPDSLQMAERVTTLPAVPVDQNGSGVSATRVERFDLGGRLIWSKDERGVIGYHEYGTLGNVTRSIQDVDDARLAVPEGWSTPAGGGLHVVTDFEYDEYGRQIQVLGPEHEVDLDGTATTVRTATWTVYKDPDHETWTARGYYVPGTETYALVNPVSIEKRSADGTRAQSIHAVRESAAGKLSAGDSFPQSSYVRWSVSLFDNAGRLTASRAYHAIPGSGDGSAGTHYDETTYGFDSMGRQNMVRSPGGTITRTVFNAFGQPACVYVGTDDSGATDEDPSAGREPCEGHESGYGGYGGYGGWSETNNMVLVTRYEYAGSSGCAGCGGGGAGQLAASIQYVDEVATRVTKYLHDWRNRQQYVIHEADDQGRVTFTRHHYDNLDQDIRVERYHDVTGDGVDADDDPQPDDVLIARSDTLLDDLGRVYQTRQYAVDVSDGSVGNALVAKIWYDAAGNAIKQQPAGSQAFTKTVYDSLGRAVKQYTGYDIDETTYAEASSVLDDTIVEQTETTYDDAGNVILTTTRQRQHNATGTGELTTPSGSQPKARVSYVCLWYDAVGRQKAVANYGTNGGTAVTRPSTVPSRSDTILVTSTEYNSAGQAHKTIDPAGREDRQEFDDAGRVVKTIQNYVDGVVSGSYADKDVTVEMTYNADGQLSTLTAKNPATGDQTTRYVYGTTLSESGIARSDLLRAEIYPDSNDTADPLGDGPDEVYDRVEYRYNRQGERIEKKDQNETVHAYEFDNLGRLIHDRVTSVGTGVDNAALRISTTYDVRGLVEKTSTYDNATVGSGNVVNEVVFEYNDSGRMVNEYQEHSGAKDANTLYVGYNHDTTAFSGAFTKGLRPTSVRYPNGRLVHFTYGSSGEMNDALNRPAAISEDNSGSPGSSVAEYTYLGLGTIVVEEYPQPEVKLDFDSGTAGEYAGFDRFGRVVDHLWRGYGASINLDRYTYGYDRASNRVYRENTTASGKDEFYTYDAVNQLKTFDRGDLNQGKTAISGTPLREEDWTLDATGNWNGYVQKTTGSTDLNQSRAHNRANEVTSASSWATPGHDRAGNMTTVPKPSSLTNGLTLKYDAWNRLVKVKDGETVVGKHEYDAQNRRIKKHIDSQSPASPNGIDRYEHYYYNLDWQILETRNTTTESDAPESLQPKYQYVWSARYVDAPVVRDENTDSDDSCDDERIYYLGDANFNVTCLVDTNGEALERYVYDPYGKATNHDGTWSNTRSDSSYSVSHLYTGRELDAETALCHYRNRHYSLDLGRFISRDPVLYEAGDSNLYRYVCNNPVILIDPAGLRPIYFKFDAFIGSHLGGVYLPGGRWLPEPLIGGWVGFYFKTDDRPFGQPGTSRLYSEGWIESYDIGHLTSGTLGPTKYYVSTDCDTSFRGNWSPIHVPGGDVIWAWRVVSKKAVPSVKTVTVSDGPCESTISITASAGYPFGGWAAPNIDYTAHFRFRITGQGKVNVSVKGTHNAFPDYEAIIDPYGPKPLYAYPTPWTGPGLIDLTLRVPFSSDEVVVFAPTGL